MITITEEYADAVVYAEKLADSAAGQIKKLLDQLRCGQRHPRRRGTRRKRQKEKCKVIGQAKGRDFDMPEKKVNRTERILSVYHLFTHCEEVSKKELMDSLPGCWKTFFRDIALLKSAGTQIRFSARRKAFVLASQDRGAPVFPESGVGRQYVEKVRRLLRCMDEMPGESPDLWYKATFPGMSLRTMQRDFAVLNAVGYRVAYERNMWNFHDCGDDSPIRRYYLDRPEGAYSLPTFKPSVF